MAGIEAGQGGAVLCSGGLDSVVLLADVARHARGARVVPLYVSVGLAWEPEERAMLERLMRAGVLGAVDPLVALRFEMSDVYPASHWAIRGEAPAFDTPDEDVYLDGRNIVLLSKAAVFMARAKLTRVFIGPLAGNPFPDATAEFFDSFARALSIGLASPIDVVAPYAALHKSDVIKRGAALGVPFALTLSCMQPERGLHCGRCSKCRERRDAFREAGIDDPTTYAVTPVR
ncbi:MAG TPA: 7-cyano-7-deazaguanine synthase [Vicinamibacterales bacterium]|nr:7-cyano-7-deazaguanine synthase [Vicinamibacterales bacterium]